MTWYVRSRADRWPDVVPTRRHTTTQPRSCALSFRALMRCFLRLSLSTFSMILPQRHVVSPLAIEFFRDFSSQKGHRINRVIHRVRCFPLPPHLQKSKFHVFEGFSLIHHLKSKLSVEQAVLLGQQGLLLVAQLSGSSVSCLPALPQDLFLGRRNVSRAIINLLRAPEVGCSRFLNTSALYSPQSIECSSYGHVGAFFLK